MGLVLFPRMERKRKNQRYDKREGERDETGRKRRKRDGIYCAYVDYIVTNVSYNYAEQHYHLTTYLLFMSTID